MPVCAQDLMVSALDYKSKCCNTEGDFRGAISRAYYACYHGATAYQAKIASPGVTKDDCGVHANLLNMLNHPTVPATDPENLNSKVIAQLYKGIYFNRRNVDYQLGETINQNNVNVVFANASKIFERI